MSKMLRSAATVAVLSALTACGPMEPAGRDAAADARIDTGVNTPDGTNPPADTGVNPPADSGVNPPGDGGGSMTCGAAYSPCDPVTNRGCPAGQACAIANQMMRMSTCIPAGRGAFGATCMTPEDCQEGLGCIGGKCARWCCGSGDNTTCRGMPGGRPGAICNINVTGTGLFACSLPDNCDIHQQNCMTATDACVPIGADGTTQCVTPVMGAMPGAACNSLNSCPRGHVCVGPEGMGTCRQVCDPTNMAMGTFSRCTAPMTCARVNGFPANIGVCTTPMM